MKTRVLFVTRASGKGGAEKHLIDLILRMDWSQVEPVALCYGVDAYSQNLNRSGRVGIQIVRETQPGDLLSFWRSFRKHRPDILVFVNGHPGMFPWFACAAARLSGARKVVAIVHKDPGAVRNSARVADPLRAMKKYISRGRLPGLICHQTICVSETMRKKLIMEKKYPTWKTVAVPNGVDLSYYKRNGVSHNNRCEFKAGPDDLLLVCVARLVPPKRIDVLITALAKIRRQFPTCKLLLVGDGPLETKLRGRAAALGLSAAVIFVGHVADVRPYLESADIFVLPSSWEGMPLVILEAMAYSLPCVATDVGGNREVIIHGETGLVVEPGSAKVLADAVLYLATHKEERFRMALNGRNRVEQCFDVEKRMGELISRLLDENCVGPSRPPIE